MKAVYYTVSRDKLGLEKKRKMQNIDYIIKYDTLGNEVERIYYGEISHAYSDSGVGCAWNYNNIRRITKSYYNTKNQLIADSTFYYHNNKVDYLSDYTIYFYDSLTNTLLSTKNYSSDKQLRNYKIYKTINPNTQQEIEIEYDSYSNNKTDTGIATYTYDDKKRLLKEVHKTKKFGWSRETEYNDKHNTKQKYYYDAYSQYPNAFDFMELNKEGKPTTIEHVGLGLSSFVYYTTLILYNEFGLKREEEELHSWDRCKENGVKSITAYEYEYYK